MLFQSRAFAWYWEDSRLVPQHCKIISIVMERKLENTVFCSNGRKVGTGRGSRDSVHSLQARHQQKQGSRAELRKTHLHDVTLITQHTKKYFTQTTQTKQKLKQNSLTPWGTLIRLQWPKSPDSQNLHGGLSTPQWCPTMFDSTHTPQQSPGQSSQLVNRDLDDKWIEVGIRG